jgi:hypothetical protein
VVSRFRPASYPHHVMSVASGDRPFRKGRSYRKLAINLGWLLLAAGISFVPKHRPPESERPMWKQVLWLILFFALFCVMALIWKGK